MDPQVNKKTLTLCMIVKDEADVILRALHSVSSFVDHICICDTGSTDGTQRIIEAYFKKFNLSGKVFERPWKNFGHNRTECFDLAKETFKDSEYLMTLDADEIIMAWDGQPQHDRRVVSIPPLDGDMMYVKTVYSSCHYYRGTFFKASLDWKWKGVLHEYPHAEETHRVVIMDKLCNFPTQDGARSKVENKYLLDAEVFEKELKEHPEDSRSWFYLAQSYFDGEKPELAIVPLEKCIEHTAWWEEEFIARLRKARYKRQAGFSFEDVMAEYLVTYDKFPTRMEPLFDIISYYRSTEQYQSAALFLQAALSISYPKECILFVEEALYHWQLQDEASIVYHKIGNSDVALYIASLIVDKPQVPPQEVERIKRNMETFKKAIDQKKEFKDG